MAYFDEDGDECNFDTWYAIIQSDRREVSYEFIDRGGKDVALHCWFAGLDNEIYKVGVTGDPDYPAHEHFNGYIAAFDTKAEAISNTASTKQKIIDGTPLF